MARSSSITKPGLVKEKLLVVEDESDIQEVLAYNLAREGYSISCLRDGRDCLDRVVKECPSLILLDAVLPGIDGLDLCRRIKKDPRTRQVPVVLLSSKTSDIDIEAGFNAGADDFVAKPFRIKELVARIKAILRRVPHADELHGSEWIVIDGLEIDKTGYRVLLHGEAVSFTAMEFRLLKFLASHPGKVFTREQIVNSVIGSNAAVSERNIDVHVLAIRRKLRDRKDLVETVRGVGYKFRDLSDVSA
jgi:two-component system phosphate regulon response regulator PhoB